MNKPIAWRYSAIVFVFASSIISCTKGGSSVVVGEVSTAQITSTTPGDGAGDVQAGTPVSALFSEDMDSTSISPATFTIVRLPGSFQISGSVSYSSGVATFMPNLPLESNASYRATLKSAVRDKKGRPRKEDFAWSFTVKDTLSPTIHHQFPPNGVDNSSVFAPIVAEFSEPVDPASITTSNFTLKKGITPVSGSILVDGNQATFVPTSQLDSASIYTATIGSGVKDLSGNALDCSGELQCVWGWTTQDAQPPTVVANLPTGTGVALAPTIYAEMSEKLSPGTVNSSTVILHDNTLGQDIPMTVQYSDGPPVRVTLAFNASPNDNPYSRLALLSNYSVTLTTGIRDAKGNPMASNFTWSFTTRNLATPAEVMESGTDAATVPSISFSAPRKSFHLAWEQGGGASGLKSILSNAATAYAPSVPVLQSGESFNPALLIEIDNNGEATASRTAADAFGNVYSVFELKNTAGKKRVFANKLVEGVPSWSPAEAAKVSLSDETNDATVPQVAVTPNGTAYCVWVQINTANADIFGNRRRRSDTNWPSSPVEVSLDSVSQAASVPKIAAASDESAWAVWVQNSNVYINRLSLDSGGNLVSSTALSLGAGSAPQVAVASDNSAYVAWINSNDVKANRVRWDGSSMAAGTLLQNFDNSTGNSSVPQIAIATMDNDDAYVVWQQGTGPSNAYVARLRKSGNDLIVQEANSLIEGLGGSTQNAKVPVVTIVPIPGGPSNDYQVFTSWTQLGSGSADDCWLNWRLSSESAWSTSRPVRLDSDTNNNAVSNVQLSVRPSTGGVQAAWQQNDGTANSIFTAEYIP